MNRHGCPNSFLSFLAEESASEHNCGKMYEMTTLTVSNKFSCESFYYFTIDGLQPIPRDSNDKGLAAMLNDTNKRI